MAKVYTREARVAAGRRGEADRPAKRTGRVW